MFDLKVSIADSIYANNWRKSKTLGEVLFNPSEATISLQREVQAIRATQGGTPEINRQIGAIKQNARAFIPSARFYGKRQLRNMVSYNGCACIDIEKKDNGSFENFSQITPDFFKKLPYVFYASRSIGGEGFFLLVRLLDDVSIYEQQVKQLHHDIFLDIGLVTDSISSDLNTARILSYDKESYYNHSPTQYNGVAKPKTAKQEINHIKKAIQMYYLTPEKFYRERIGKLVDEVKANEVSLANDYNELYKIACGLVTCLPFDGLEPFKIISLYHPEMDFVKSEKVYVHAYKNLGEKIDFTYLRKIAKRRNIKI